MKEYNEKPEGWIEDKEKAEAMANEGKSMRDQGAQERVMDPYNLNSGVGMDKYADVREEVGAIKYEILEKAKRLSETDIDDLVKQLEKWRHR